ncbi:HAMP domain-containing protein [Mucilaginibacter sp. BJC16-A38]|uniref:HAMP domain-containing sensor histidine kinase n=1 Tax=Mucilaginibacter phenanthrenivorans TaxID=1234842 RepID=UPI0021572AD6|nr:ATP-binding protein [Mucilaginibacter phenanthrenivorans]MCR8558869.1 HAMP domain-containing protein [Mucilaginibacter phenanthrenivorans]
MKIKNKLRLGFGFLFVIVLFFGVVAIFYIHEISDSAKVILKNNYESLSFAREMRTVLDENKLPLNQKAITDFNHHLVLQENNITEKGEKEATVGLRKYFDVLQAPDSSPLQRDSAQYHARAQLRKIELLNMQAIVRKNDRAQASVNKATILLGLVGTFTFLVLFSFSVNFPGFIADPLRKLVDGIREIGQKNYNQHLNFSANDEFADVATAFNEMSDRLQEWENSNLATVLSEKQRIETIIEQMQDAIIGLNEKNEILFINTVAENILNLKEKKIVGQPAEKFTATNDLFKSIIENSALRSFKIALNGKESYFQLENREIVIPNLDPNPNDVVSIGSKSVGQVYVLRNVTEFKERDEAKTNFIATISHELKTPISSIKMSLKLLNDERIGPVNPQQTELLGHIKDDSDRLLKITSELLDLSQVETGNIQLNFVVSDPREIVNYALNSVKFPAEQKGISLQVMAPASISRVHADLEKTAWVLVNFLSNALRYSGGKSKVIIELKEEGDKVIFAVKDFGKGIDEQYQQRLFERYFQVPTDGQNKSGSGLGLAISKDFIEAQQGEIWVESAIGEGSTFYFSLPAHQEMKGKG